MLEREKRSDGRWKKWGQKNGVSVQKAIDRIPSCGVCLAGGEEFEIGIRGRVLSRDGTW